MSIYSGFSPLKMVIFNSYVKLPEGMTYARCKEHYDIPH